MHCRIASSLRSNWVWLAYLGFVVVGGLSINAFYKLKKQKQKLGEVVNPSLLALLYAVYSALFGTLSVVFAKILAVLVSVWLNNKVRFKICRLADLTLWTQP